MKLFFLFFIGFTMGFCADTFKDVQENRWSCGAIMELHDKNIIHGYDHTGGEYFGPTDSVTEGQLAKIIVRLFYPKHYLQPDSDLVLYMSFMESVGAYANRTNGMTYSKVNKPVKRRDATVMLKNIYDLKKGLTTACVLKGTEFTDQPSMSSPEEHAVCQLSKINVMNGKAATMAINTEEGYVSTYFDLDGQLSREQFAVSVLKLAYNLSGSNTSLPICDFESDTRRKMAQQFIEVHFTLLREQIEMSKRSDNRALDAFVKDVAFLSEVVNLIEPDEKCPTLDFTLNSARILYKELFYTWFPSSTVSQDPVLFEFLMEVLVELFKSGMCGSKTPKELFKDATKYGLKISYVGVHYNWDDLPPEDKEAIEKVVLNFYRIVMLYVDKRITNRVTTTTQIWVEGVTTLSKELIVIPAYGRDMRGQLMMPWLYLKDYYAYGESHQAVVDSIATLPSNATMPDVLRYYSPKASSNEVSMAMRKIDSVKNLFETRYQVYLDLQ